MASRRVSSAGELSLSVPIWAMFAEPSGGNRGYDRASRKHYDHFIGNVIPPVRRLNRTALRLHLAKGGGSILSSRQEKRTDSAFPVPEAHLQKG